MRHMNITRICYLMASKNPSYRMTIRPKTHDDKIVKATRLVWNHEKQPYETKEIHVFVIGREDFHRRMKKMKSLFLGNKT